MAVTVGAPALPRALANLIAMVRAELRDFPELNRLVAGVESSDRFIALAIRSATEDWNTTIPLISRVTYDTHPSTYLLVLKAKIEIFKQVMVLQSRNHLSYSDGQGATVNSSDKAPMLQSMITLFVSEYEPKKREMKIALNVAGGWGDSVSSDLAVVNTFWGEWA